MDGVPEVFGERADAVEFARPAQRDGVELYRAHVVRHAFEPHVHEGFGLGAIEAGVERFRYRGSEHLALGGSLVMMNPDELHTGQAETRDGWRYRMVYIEPALVERITGARGWWFGPAVARDPARARRVGRLLERLWTTDEPLGFDSVLATLLAEFRVHAQRAQHAPPEGALRFAPVVEYMRVQLHRKLTLDELAAVAGLSPFHFLRRFRAQHHATPQQMLMALRVFEAKQRLAGGELPAQVAAAVGLADQAHLNRAFCNRYGVTPGRYRAQVSPRRAVTTPIRPPAVLPVP